MLLGEYSVRTRKTPQHKSTYTINTRLCHRGSNPAPASSHPVPQPLFRCWSQTRLSGWRFKATEARDRGGGVNAYLYVKSSQVTFIYIAPLTIQIVTKHCTISKLSAECISLLNLVMALSSLVQFK